MIINPDETKIDNYIWRADYVTIIRSRIWAQLFKTNDIVS